MNFVERTLRLMTQLNIAATLATGAWVVYSGLQIVGGQPSAVRPVRMPMPSPTQAVSDPGQPALDGTRPPAADCHCDCDCRASVPALHT